MSASDIHHLAYNSEQNIQILLFKSEIKWKSIFLLPKMKNSQFSLSKSIHGFQHKSKTITFIQESGVKVFAQKMVFIIQIGVNGG